MLASILKNTQGGGAATVNLFNFYKKARLFFINVFCFKSFLCFEEQNEAHTRGYSAVFKHLELK